MAEGRTRDGSEPLRKVEDLKQEIMELVERHSELFQGEMRQHVHAIVFTALTELALALALPWFGPKALEMWLGAFNSAELKQGPFDA